MLLITGIRLANCCSLIDLSPFFGSFAMSSFCQSLGISLLPRWFQTELIGLPLLAQCLLSVILSVVHHSLVLCGFSISFIASLNSVLVGIVVSMSSSGALPWNRWESWGSSLLRRVLKYAVNLDSCSFSVVGVFPFASLTGVVICSCDLPDICKLCDVQLLSFLM